MNGTNTSNEKTMVQTLLTQIKYLIQSITVRQKKIKIK